MGDDLDGDVAALARSTVSSAARTDVAADVPPASVSPDVALDDTGVAAVAGVFGRLARGQRERSRRRSSAPADRSLLFM